MFYFVSNVNWWNNCPIVIMVYLQMKIINMATDINSSSLTIAAVSKDPGMPWAGD